MIRNKNNIFGHLGYGDVADMLIVEGADYDSEIENDTEILMPN